MVKSFGGASFDSMEQVDVDEAVLDLTSFWQVDFLLPFLLTEGYEMLNVKFRNHRSFVQDRSTRSKRL